MKEIVLKSTVGLCNRLGFMFGNLLHARTKGYTIRMIWPLNSDCSDHFLDFFEPVKDLEFTTDDLPALEGWHPPYEYARHFLFEDLHPKPAVLVEVEKFQTEEYNAIHVRGTDHIKGSRECWGSRHMTADSFVPFVESSLLPVFLATDDYNVQRFFRDRFGDKMIFRPLTPPARRISDLKTALFDLYMAVGAKGFMGTLGSSYSGVIDSLRKRKGVNLVYADTKNWGDHVTF